MFDPQSASSGTADPGTSASAQYTSSPQLPLAPIKPTPLHPLEEDVLVLQHTRSSIDSPIAARDDSASVEPDDDQCHLPKRAPDADADRARDKLDRIAKAQQSKCNWAKSTGVTLAARAFGQQKRRMRRREHGISSSEESSDEDAASHGDDETHGRRGQVKLMITGNPVVSKVADAATRAKGRFRTHMASPEASPTNEEPHPRFSISRPGSVLARRFRAPSATPPPEAVLRGAAPSSPPSEPPSRRSIEATSALSESLKPRARHTLNPELLVVDEEGQAHQASHTTDQKPLRRPAIPFANSFNSHSPSSRASSIPGSPVAEQPKTFSMAPSSSFTGGLIYDEPDAHEHDHLTAPLGFTSPAPSSSHSSGLSDDEDDDAIASDSDDGQDNMLKLQSLCLEHSDAPTKEQLKRQRKLIRREIRRRKALGEPIDDLPHLHGRAGQLGHMVSSRVSKGLHYASSQSRNRRAIDRYSPHPMQLTLQTTDLPRSSSAQSATRERGFTPFSTMTPSVSRNNNTFGDRHESIATVASSRRSSMTVDDDDVNDGDGASTPRRFGTVDRSILSSRNSIRKFLYSPNVLKRHRRKKWEAEMAAIERAAEEQARKADPDAELDTMLAKYAEQQAPSDANKIKYEFDVLYENQRGLLVFGVPKFSPRTLFQWDPSPWTSAAGKRSPYNIANAQLPDPSWEWVYHEWYIDMTGDVDEAGWQYSGNFGRRFWPNVHFPHGRLGLPKTGVEGIREMNARLGEKEQKRREKESTKEDGGFEAIKRTARARTSKWTGSPDAWTFVRRRRWIRLRRRKPLVPAAPKGGEATPAKATSPTNEIPVQEHGANTLFSPGKVGIKPGHSDDDVDDESSLGDGDESDFSSEEDAVLYAPALGRSSGFLPRRLPGNLSNGPNPTKSKDPQHRKLARKHAKEFTGTIRELKSLLPSIIAMDREAKVSRASTGLTASQSSYKWALAKINKVDARNPFISWHFVKQRLQDEDMAFPATTLRTMERKFQQRQLVALHKKTGLPNDDIQLPSHPPIPSKFADNVKSIRSGGLGDEPGPSNSQRPANQEDPKAKTAMPSLQESFALATPTEGHELTREALVEINFARVLRVLRACKVDRQRMDLWKLWLGVVTLDSLMETARREDLAALGLLSPAELAVDSVHTPSSPAIDPVHLSGESSFRYRQRAERAKARWRSSVPLSDASDVWDVLERKLDDILLLFEFQSNRAHLIRLLLTVHERLHPDHVYRDRSLRSNPIELFPTHVHGEPAEMGGPPGGAFGSRFGGWKRAGLPRLEFFSDLQRILAALPGNDASTNSEYILSQPSPSEELEPVAMPLGHHSSNPLIAQLEAEAETESFLDKEHILTTAPVVRAEQEEIQRSVSAAADRLGVITSRNAGGRSSRSPSPIMLTPSVPLPYRHSPLSSGPVSQGSFCSSLPRSSLSFADQAKPTASVESTPASSARGADEDATHQSRPASIRKLDTITSVSEEANTDTQIARSLLSPAEQHKAAELPTATTPQPQVDAGVSIEEGESKAQPGEPTRDIEAASTVTAVTAKTSLEESGDSSRNARNGGSRPPIPVRSESVSPLTTTKDRF